MPDVVKALADFVGTKAGLARAGATIALWANQIDERSPADGVVSNAADPIAVLRAYSVPNPVQTAPMLHAAIQCVTRSRLAANAMATARLIHGSLLDAEGMPLVEQAITGFKIKGITRLTSPGISGLDAQGRTEVVFNFDLSFYEVA